MKGRPSLALEMMTLRLSMALDGPTAATPPFGPLRRVLLLCRVAQSTRGNAAPISRIIQKNGPTAIGEQHSKVLNVFAEEPLTTCKNARLFSSTLLLILLAAAAASAQITPTDDSYTSTLSGSTNYGTSGVLDLQSGNKSTVFVRFDLSAIPTGYTGANVTQATLKLYVNSVPTGGTFNVDYVLGSWSEKTITANLEPAVGSTITGGVSLTTASKNDYILINVTAALNAWLDGTQANDGLALVANSPLVASFTSKENTATSHAPELDIVFSSTGAQGPPGPQGAQGPTGAQGPSGLMGAQGLPGTNGAGFNFRSAFDPTATYAVNDEVTYSGSTYAAIAASSGPNNPTPDQDSAAWSVMAQQGAVGAAGPQGAPGAQGSQGPMGLTGPIGPQGVTGVTGPQGQTGPMGPIGVQGPQGAAGTNGTGFNFRNAFDPTASYAVSDVVTYNGSTYTAIAVNSGPNNPTPDTNPGAWSGMALQGAAGAAGSQGVQGTTGAAGPVGPMGLTGATGPQGSQGITGPQGPFGPQGPQGVQGPTGPVGQGLGATGAALLQWYPQSYSVGYENLALAFDGANIWVVSIGSGGANNVNKIQASTGATVGTYTVVGPQGVAFDGTSIWVTSANQQTGGAVVKFSASTGTVVGTYSVGGIPNGVAFDGTNIWVANQGSNSVTKLLAATGAVVGTYFVGQNPVLVAFDGTNVWVTNSGSGTVTKLLASTGAVVGTYSVLYPYGVAFDGTNIWVANNGSSTITKLLASTGAVVGSYSVGAGPYGVAFDGTNVWVTNSGSSTVTKLLASTGAVVGTYSVGLYPYGAAFDGTNIWVANRGDNTITKIPVN
jgi:hypothetical protein